MSKLQFLNEHNGIKINDTVKFHIETNSRNIVMGYGIVKSMASMQYGIASEPRIIVNIDFDGQTYMRNIDLVEKAEDCFKQEIKEKEFTLQYIKGGK